MPQASRAVGMKGRGLGRGGVLHGGLRVGVLDSERVQRELTPWSPISDTPRRHGGEFNPLSLALPRTQKAGPALETPAERRRLNRVRPRSRAARRVPIAPFALVAGRAARKGARSRASARTTARPSPPPSGLQRRGP